MSNIVHTSVTYCYHSCGTNDKHCMNLYVSSGGRILRNIKTFMQVAQVYIGRKE
jgi:hypothetical protein